MKFRPIIFFVCLALPLLAHAFDTYRIGSRLIRIGDSVSELVALIGAPLYKEPIETGRGGFIGERWQYRLDNKAVQFTIRGGRIEHIDEIRDSE
jgi:hypothetical protein